MLNKKIFIYIFGILNIYLINNYVFAKNKTKSEFCGVHNKTNLFHAIEKVKSSGYAIPNDGVIRINANQASGTKNNYNIIGNVILEKDNLILNSKYINLHLINGNYVVNIPSNFLFQNLNYLLQAQNLFYNIDQNNGYANNFIFNIIDTKSNNRFQGQGSKIEILNKNSYILYDTKVNTCEVQDASWYIKSKKIEIDKLNNIWVAKNAQLVLGNFPILFLPWIDFPLNGNRKSGFLNPIIGLSNDNGLELSIPYYLNLAANYDATIAPYLYYRRGLSFITEFRYLQPKYSGNINFQILPHDKISSKQELLNNKSKRYLLNLKNNYFVSDNLKFIIDFNKASDNYFYRDLGNRQDLIENTYLNQQISVYYNKNIYGGYLNAILTAQKYQILQDQNNNIEEVYNTLPQLTLNYSKDILKYGAFELFSQFSRFTHDHMQNGSREIIYPFLKLNYGNEWFIFRPKIGIHTTFYQIDSFIQKDIHKDAYNKTRVLPILSLDSGLIFERNFKIFNKNYIQTLQPKIFYVYIPHKEQNNLPNFDSSENDFTYEQLFKENRFSGNDRINSANHISLALMSKIYDTTNGIERFKIGIGQIFYFKRDIVNLGNIEYDKNKNKSDIIFFSRGYINKSLYFFSDVHYDNNYHITSKYTSGLTYNPEIGKIISLRLKHDNNAPGVFNVRKLSNQVDIAGQWPIHNNYYLLAKHTYSFSDHKTLENVFGIEYKSKCGCWGANFVLQRYLTDYNKHKTSVFFRLSLKGLGGLGSKTEDKLKRSIPNYVPISEVR